MSASELVHLRGGLVVPVAAYLAVLDLERAGHRLELDGEDIIVIPAKASCPIDPDMLAALRLWKRHAIMLLNYTADDSHLVDTPAVDIAQAPTRRHA